jgi:hypothetical protein
MGGDATAGFQDVAGDGEFVGGRADVSKRVMQDEVFEMNEFTVDPEACASRKCERSRKPSPTAERATHSSRRARATPASEIGRNRLWMGNLARS